MNLTVRRGNAASRPAAMPTGPGAHPYMYITRGTVPLVTGSPRALMCPQNLRTPRPPVRRNPGVRPVLLTLLPSFSLSFLSFLLLDRLPELLEHEFPIGRSLPLLIIPELPSRTIRLCACSPEVPVPRPLRRQVSCEADRPRRR